ncbi:hypothetical protein, partial [Planotetraspora silvatica]
MAEHHLRLLGIEDSFVTARMNFLESYANTVQRELTDQGEGARVAGQILDVDDVRWTQVMEIASAFREAASWAILADGSARKFLLRAADMYDWAGLAFGSFLRTMARPRPFDDLNRAVERLAVASSGREAQTPAALRPPQQQAYLLLACTAASNGDGEIRQSLRAIASESSHQRGVTPFGALGIPIRQPWNIAIELLREPTFESTDMIAEHLISMYRRYAAAMELGRANGYLWHHGAAPVEVVDLDLIGITALAATRL